MLSSPTSIIDSATLAEVAQMEVLDSTGRKIHFGSIYENERAVVVFIRHFGCGRCQDYTVQLASVRQEALLEAGTKITIIGCGEPTAINDYRGYTGFKGDIYTNPSLSLYTKLGMVSQLSGPPAGETKKSYAAQSSLMSIVTRSLGRILAHPTQIGKLGPISQQGGDFIFGPGDECSYVSRMKHTEDHVEVAELMQAARVAYP